MGEREWQIGHMQLDGETNMKYNSERNSVEKLLKMEVANWAKESGKLAEGKWKIGRREVASRAHAVGQGETNMKYDLERNPVEKC